MNIVKFTKLKDNKYKVLFDDNNVVTLYDNVIIKYNLLVNKKIDVNKYNEILSYNSQFDSYYKAIKYINRKLRTKKEIEKYLEKDYDKKTIDNTINKLINDGYLNDNTYVNAYINDQINLTLNGPYKIKKELSSLGLKEEIIDEKLNQIDLDVWKEKIKKYINKKIKSNHKNSCKKLKEKITYDLVNMGYKKDEIISALDETEFNTDNNIIIKEADKIYNKLKLKYQDEQLIYQLKNKLFLKGFSNSEIDYYLEHKKTDF